MRTLAILLPLVLLAQIGEGAAFLYDAGTAKSTLSEGFELLAADTVAADNTRSGWDSGEGVKAYVRPYTEAIENQSAGRTDPPPIYTNALTEDCLTGDSARTLRVPVPAGQYEVYLICGTSYNLRDQYFDFDVKVGDAVQRLRFEGAYQFRNVRFEAETNGEPLAITFEPLSRWAVNAVMVWDAQDDGRIEAMIEKLEEQMYSLPPEEMEKWKEDPLPPTPELDTSLLSRQDLFRGFTIFHKPWPECVYPNTNPYPHETNPELRIFATRGEYEPITFSVKTFKDLSDVDVMVSDIGPVKADTVDIRHVRYMKARPNYSLFFRYHTVPDVLERFDTLDLPADHTHRFWLTVRVPEDAQPGMYQGNILFTANGETAEIPVRLRVLDIDLTEDPDKIYGIYYRDPLDRWAGAADEVSKAYFLQKSEMEHADMVAHGTRNVILSAWCREENAEGKFVADWTTLSKKIELARKYDFKPPFVVSINTGGVYAKHMGGKSLGSHIRLVEDPPQAFYDEMTRMAAFVESERVKNGWPEFLYYPIDEPGTSTVAVRFMTNLMKALRKAGVKTYVTADPVHEQFQPMMPYVNVWCCQPFNPDREAVLKDMAERDVEYWCYPNHVNGENDHTPVSGARMTYGFGFWRSGFKVLTPWIYSSDVGDPWNYLDGSAQDFFNRHEDDGTPIPVAMWEAYREGYDDYRYVYTLETLIEKARQAGKDDAAAQAEKELKYVWDAIRVQTKYKYDDLWSPEEYDVYRWLVAREILNLQAALK